MPFSLSMLSQLLGGLGLFFYGVNTLSDGLQKLAASKLKEILESFTRNSLSAAIFGTTMTIVLQSSAASTVMVVEFVNSGLMSLTQALGVSLGSSLGTYVLIKLISFPLINFALVIIFVGFIAYLILKSVKAKRIGQSLIGFGCVFIGMSYMSSSFSPLKDMPEVYSFLSNFGTIPVLGIIAGIVLTALMQSSSAFLAIMVSLANNGLLSIQAIIALVMGAHIGGTVTTLISSLGTEKIDALRVALANSLYRVIATIIIMPLGSEFAKFVQWLTPDLAGEVANAYLFSTIFMVILFLPLNNILANLLIKFVHSAKREAKEIKLRYMTKASLEIPTIALNQANQEIQWLGQKILGHMYELLPRTILTGDVRWTNEIEETEKFIDQYYILISKYLSSLFNQSMTQEQIVQTHNYQLIAKEWEYLADRIVVMSRFIGKLYSEGLRISPEYLDKFNSLYFAISKNFLHLIHLLNLKDSSRVDQIIAIHDEITELHKSLQVNMVCELGEDLTSSKNIMLDIYNLLFRIGEHLKNIATIANY